MMEKEMEKETKGVKVRDPAGLTIALKELADHLTLEKKFAEAEPIHKRVIEIDSRAYGPLDELTLGDMRKLAEFYLAQGKYTEAETQYRKVLEAVGRRNLSPSARATVGVSQDDITK